MLDQRLAVLVVDLAELAGDALVPVREGQPHEVVVPAVHGRVPALAVEQHQTHVDGVEDRLAHPALELDHLLAATHPLTALARASETTTASTVVITERDRLIPVGPM